MDRLPYSKTSEPNAVELLFAEKFKDLKRMPMNEEASKIMIGLILAPPDSDELNSLLESAMSKVASKRFEVLGYTMDAQTNIFLTYICETPGDIVMYCHYLAYWCKKKNEKHVSFSEFCENIFPFGFPSRDDIDNLWDSIKVDKEGNPGSDNLLDYFQASSSIMGDI